MPGSGNTAGNSHCILRGETQQVKTYNNFHVTSTVKKNKAGKELQSSEVGSGKASLLEMMYMIQSVRLGVWGYTKCGSSSFAAI